MFEKLEKVGFLEKLFLFISESILGIELSKNGADSATFTFFESVILSAASLIMSTSSIFSWFSRNSSRNSVLSVLPIMSSNNSTLSVSSIRVSRSSVSVIVSDSISETSKFSLFSELLSLTIFSSDSLLLLFSKFSVSSCFILLI